MRTHPRALAAGERWHGASIHYVTAGLDGGPVVLQGRLAVRPEESEEALRAQAQALEQRIYPQALG